MADIFWLQDEDNNKLILDSNIQEINIGGFKRDYKVIEYAGAPGGQIRGFGKVGARKLKVSRREFIANETENSFMNTNRDAFMIWISKVRYKDVWFYIQRPDGKIIRTLAYPQVAGANMTDYVKYTELIDFTILLPEGLFTNTSSTTETKTIVDSSVHNLNLTNSGTWEAPGIYKFTPTSTESLFQVDLADQFGFKLEGNFIGGTEIAYNTADNSLTIGGLEVVTSQFLTAGTVFQLPTEAQTLNIITSGAGDFELEYNERYV
jgi:hypothetical protein